MQSMAEHTTWDAIKALRPETPEQRAGYEQAKRKYEVGRQEPRRREECDRDHHFA